MGVLDVVVIAATVVLCVALAVALARSGHPENGCGHVRRPLETPTERFDHTSDRPAGPDAESMLVEVAGDPQPGAPATPGGQLGAPVAPGERARARTGGA